MALRISDEDEISAVGRERHALGGFDVAGSDDARLTSAGGNQHEPRRVQETLTGQRPLAVGRQRDSIARPEVGGGRAVDGADENARR
jgi:hypothetical protein